MRAGRLQALLAVLAFLVVLTPACGKKGPPRLPPPEVESAGASSSSAPAGVPQE